MSYPPRQAAVETDRVPIRTPFPHMSPSGQITIGAKLVALSGHVVDVPARLAIAVGWTDYWDGRLQILIAQWAVEWHDSLPDVISDRLIEIRLFGRWTKRSHLHMLLCSRTYGLEPVLASRCFVSQFESEESWIKATASQREGGRL